MKLKFIYLLFYCSILFLPGCAQSNQATVKNATVTGTSNEDFKFFAFIPGNYIALEVDALDNIYLMTTGYQLKKLSPAFDSIAAFNDVKRYGNPSYIDVSNPFKLLVYYKNFSTAVILDRLLTARNTINLRKENIFTVKAITTSYDNNLWIFDEQDYKLKKISNDGKLLFESNDLRLIVDTIPSPIQITDSENFVYLYDPEKGFYVFDYYGAFKNKIPFINWTASRIANGKLYGFSDGHLFSYMINSLQLKKYRLPEFFKDYSDIKAVNGKLYMLKKEGVEIYNVL